MVHKMMWSSMNIQWAHLDDMATVKQKTKFFGLTKSLEMYHGYVTGYNYENAGDPVGVGRCAEEALQHILEQCDPLKLRTLQFLFFIPRGGFELAGMIFSHLESLSLHNVYLEDEEWASVGAFPNLVALSLYNCNADNSLLTYIRSLSYLRELSIQYCRRIDNFLTLKCAADMALLESFRNDMDVDPDEDGAPILQYGGYPPVADLPDTLTSLFKNSHLKELTLGHEKLQDELFFGIAEGMPELTVLNLHSSTRYFTDEMLKHVAALKSLKRFGLLAIQITDKGLRYISTSKTLQELTLESCENITDNGVLHVSKMPSLNVFSMQTTREGSGITDQGLAYLVESTTITSLGVSGNDYVTDRGLASLHKLPKLACLHLRYNPFVTDQGIKYLIGLSHLVYLDLHESEGITDLSLDYISQLKTLRYLDIGSANITNRGLAYLAKLPSLLQLDLSNCQGIDDDGLKHVGKIFSLRALALLGCGGITDAGLSYLLALRLLEKLDLVSCCQVTGEGVKVLGNELPSLKWFGVGEDDADDVTEEDVLSICKFKTVAFCEDFYQTMYYAFDGDMHRF